MRSLKWFPWARSGSPKTSEAVWKTFLLFFARHIPHACQLLRKLLDGHILYDSIMERREGRISLYCNGDIRPLIDRCEGYQRWWWRAGELNPRPLRCERSA